MYRQRESERAREREETLQPILRKTPRGGKMMAKRMSMQLAVDIFTDLRQKLLLGFQTRMRERERERVNPRSRCERESGPVVADL